MSNLPSSTPSLIPSSLPDLNSQTLQRLLPIISTAFSTDPITTLFVRELDSLLTPPITTPHPIPLSRISAHFSPLLHRSLAPSGPGFVIESGEWSAVSIWELLRPDNLPEAVPDNGNINVSRNNLDPISHHPAHVIPPTSRPHLQDYLANISALKSQVISPQESYYHLFMLARNTRGTSVPGAVTACVTPILQLAGSQGRKVWLEATTSRAKAIYEKWGFRIVGSFRVGGTSVGPDGWEGRDGSKNEGIEVWGMVWEAGEGG